MNKVAKRTKVKMLITDTPTGPWQKIATDFVGELPTTNEGNKFIMTIQDNFLKFVILTPLKLKMLNQLRKLLWTMRF